jgi:hypothetical protein
MIRRPSKETSFDVVVLSDELAFVRRVKLNR